MLGRKSRGDEDRNNTCRADGESSGNGKSDRKNEENMPLTAAVLFNGPCANELTTRPVPRRVPCPNPHGGRAEQSFDPNEKNEDCRAIPDSRCMYFAVVDMTVHAATEDEKLEQTKGRQGSSVPGEWKVVTGQVAKLNSEPGELPLLS